MLCFEFHKILNQIKTKQTTESVVLCALPSYKHVAAKEEASIAAKYFLILDRKKMIVKNKKTLLYDILTE